MGLPSGARKNPPTNAGDAGDVGSIPGSGRSLEVGSGNPLQYPCLENSMGRGAWQATVHGVPKGRTQWSVCAGTRTHTHTHTHIYLVVPGLSCGMWDLVSQLGMEFRPSASGALSLSHWATRKSLLLLFDVTNIGEPGSMTWVLTAQEDGFSFVQSGVFQPWHCYFGVEQLFAVGLGLCIGEYVAKSLLS